MLNKVPPNQISDFLNFWEIAFELEGEPCILLPHEALINTHLKPVPCVCRCACVAMAVAMRCCLFTGAVSLFLSPSVGLFASPLLTEITSKYPCERVSVCWFLSSLSRLYPKKVCHRVLYNSQTKSQTSLSWSSLNWGLTHTGCNHKHSFQQLRLRFLPSRVSPQSPQRRLNSLLLPPPYSHRFVDAGVDTTTSHEDFDEWIQLLMASDSLLQMQWGWCVWPSDTLMQLQNLWVCVVGFKGFAYSDFPYSDWPTNNNSGKG